MMFYNGLFIFCINFHVDENPPFFSPITNLLFQEMRFFVEVIIDRVLNY